MGFKDPTTKTAWCFRSVLSGPPHSFGKYLVGKDRGIVGENRLYYFLMMRGLLRRAKTFRSSPSNDSSSESTPTKMEAPDSERANRDDDLPDEERDAILSEIDRISRENRVAASPESARTPARRGGGRLVLVANIVAAVILALGVWLLSQFYSQEDEDLRSASAITVTTEGRLIEEIRRESREQVARKDEQIEEVQAELEAIRAQQREIEEDIEARVSEREAELRAQVDAEIEAERRRLIEEGLSDEEIERLMREFERRRIAELRGQVEEFRSRLAAEREERRRELAELEAEVSQTLEQARQERAAILEEARRNERELRERFEA